MNLYSAQIEKVLAVIKKTAIPILIVPSHIYLALDEADIENKQHITSDWHLKPGSLVINGTRIIPSFILNPNKIISAQNTEEYEIE